MANTSKYRRGKKRRMDKFNLAEVSFVDRPAQTPATAELVKADVDQLLDDEAWDIEKFSDMANMSTTSVEGHQHGISVTSHDERLCVMLHFAAGEDGEMHDHQIVRGADGQFELTENRGHTHELDQARLQQIVFDASMNKAVETNEDLLDLVEGFEDFNGSRTLAADYIKRRAKEFGVSNKLPKEGILADLLRALSGEPTVKKETNVSKTEIEKSSEKIAELEAQIAELAKAANMTAEEKAYMEKLETEEEQKAFRDMDKAGRKAAMDQAAAKAAQAAEADAVVYTADNGDVYRKSDDARLIKMAKERDEERRETIRLRKAAEDSDLAKRAEEDLANFPGTVEVRKAILKAVDGISDEDTRKAAHDALKAQNTRMAGALTTVGSSSVPTITKNSDKAEAEAELERLAKELAKKENIDFYEAYERVSEINPEILAKAIAG